MLKVVFILFLALTANQAKNISKPPTRAEQIQNELEEEALRSVKDEVLKLLQELEDLVESAANKVKEEATKLEEKLKNAANKAVDKVKSELDEVLDGLLDKLQEEVDKHADKDTSACVDQYRPELQNLPQKFIDDEVSCVTDKYNEGKKIVTDVIDTITNVYNEITNIKNDINNCGSGLSSAVCLTKLLAKLGKDVVSLPKEITEAYVKAETFIDTLLPTLDVCATGKVADMSEEGLKILAKATACIAGL
ncbi:uncharacterized protein LOC126265066 [Aethina tumida]|uniref:uncharacterized protein LOC126265066 n=1 Tax=Aethina tumida TaxID=116153 RepID=UPI002148C162|nr:uncharacterized protein LOC126265066 [Aethina tumida]